VVKWSCRITADSKSLRRFESYPFPQKKDLVNWKILFIFVKQIRNDLSSLKNWKRFGELKNHPYLCKTKWNRQRFRYKFHFFLKRFGELKKHPYLCKTNQKWFKFFEINMVGSSNGPDSHSIRWQTEVRILYRLQKIKKVTKIFGRLKKTSYLCKTNLK
jgi:hypothetical protein